MIPKIYINPGHSEKDPGAVGYETERRLNVAVSKHMNEYLLANYECETLVGSGDSLYAICDEANAWGANLFVSPHNNAGGGDGFECYVYSNKTVDLGKTFAKHVKAAGQNLRSSSVAPGVKIRTNLAVLYRTTMPSILLEGAFVDNKKDIQDWNDDAELKVLGIAYAKAAAEYLKLEEKEQKPAETKKEGYTMTLRNLKRGSSGEDVRALQILLSGRGYNGNMHTPDGIFGPNTEGAVKLYQKAKGLTVDGIAGPATMASLLGL